MVTHDLRRCLLHSPRHVEIHGGRVMPAQALPRLRVTHSSGGFADLWSVTKCDACGATRVRAQK